MASINYEDERFTNLEEEKQAALDQSNSTYDNLIDESKGYYDNLIDQSKDWADKQAEIQNERTDFTIDTIEQQKEKAEKDYEREQKGAYQDYMKQMNAYGSNKQAAGQSGLSGSGWAQTIQAGFYNTYQNRYAQARESYNNIVMNYDNNIKEAQLQNSSALATIYANAQAEQLELALQSFTVIKDLTLSKQNAYMTIDSEYNNRWRQVEQQINTENALAEQIRQYNESLAEQKRQADLDYKYKQQALALQKQQSYSGGGAYLYDGGSKVQQIKTQYYSGDIAENVGGFGYMGKDNNGVAYQPKGVYINGKACQLSKTGKTVSQYVGGSKNNTNSSGVNVDKQNVWQATSNGKTYYYIWNGTKNQYERIK